MPRGRRPLLLVVRMAVTCLVYGCLVDGERVMEGGGGRDGNNKGFDRFSTIAEGRRCVWVRLCLFDVGRS